MIAARLSSVWQVAGVAGAALCCYLVSQSVASERAALDRLDRQIAHAQDDIRHLGTEIGARSRMAQIERWNASVLALQAPRPGQFVADGVQLASLYGRAGRSQLPLDQAVMATKGAVDTVAYTPAQPAPSTESTVQSSAPARVPAPAVQAPAAEPLLRTATFVRAKANPLAPETPPITRAALSVKPADATVEAPQSPQPKVANPVVKASVAKPAAKSAAVAEVTSIKPALVKPGPVKPGKVKLASLLPADIGALAAAESKGRKAPAARDPR